MWLRLSQLKGIEMLEKLNIKLNHCYGIKSLETDIGFEHGNVTAIYAPNGSMKTSFSQVFKDLSEGLIPKDRIFDDVQTFCAVTDQNDVEIQPQNIFVIESLNDTFKSKITSSLLVNKKLKEEHDAITADIVEKQNTLFSNMKKQTGFTKLEEQEQEFSSMAKVSVKDILKGLGRYERDVRDDEPNSDMAALKYKKIFNPQVATFLSKPEVISSIAEYAESYNDLIDQSTYFKRGIFSHNNASTIATSLTKNGWFDSGHSVNMNNAGLDEPIKTEADLVALIQSEKEKILSNKSLQTTFNKIDKFAEANAATKEFRDIITDNKFLIAELADVEKFKSDLWISYFQTHKSDYQNLMHAYDMGKGRIEEIVAIAKSEATRWKAVIDQFNKRFKVPFEVTMNNQDGVILNREAPMLGYKFKNLEDDRERVVTEKELKTSLSNGEKRALYILNIIFEVEARIEDNVETLFIIDDIADSFDYKNKYAIIEYLKDISSNPLFKSIILTHNFDFYRTIKSRLSVHGNQKLLTTRNGDGIQLVKDSFGDNPFAAWREDLGDLVNVIASIPFVRNLAEYSGNAPIQSELTKLLHLKPDTALVTMKNLEDCYKDVLHSTVVVELPFPDRTVLEVIYETAAAILTKENDTIELKDKIVLSIAIRLLAEKMMIMLIDDAVFVAGLAKNQTGKLFRKLKAERPDDVASIALIERVQLMTPENIHVNSFMFEPILDMSNEHLRQLYTDILAAQLA